MMRRWKPKKLDFVLIQVLQQINAWLHKTLGITLLKPHGHWQSVGLIMAAAVAIQINKIRSQEIR